jgi:hypothetical protein
LHQVEVRLRLRAKNPDYLRPRYVWFFWGCCIILICTFLIIAIVEFSENLWVAAFFLLTDNGVYLLFWFLSPWEHSAKDSVGDTVLVQRTFRIGFVLLDVITVLVVQDLAQILLVRLAPHSLQRH